MKNIFDSSEKGEIFFPKMWLYQKYWVEGLSLKEIGQIALEKFPLYPYSKDYIAHKIRNDMKKQGIRRRNSSESTRLAHKTLGHKSHEEKKWEDTLKTIQNAVDKLRDLAAKIEEVSKAAEGLKKAYSDATK